ncbi:MAG: hypothetical protein ACXWLX_10535, partial [Rhizomicrobium sp.]
MKKTTFAAILVAVSATGAYAAGGAKPFSFSARVTNRGPRMATTVTLTVDITGPKSKIKVDNTSQCSVAAGKVTCAVPNLGNHLSRTVKVSGVATDVGAIKATVNVSSSLPDQN